MLSNDDSNIKVIHKCSRCNNELNKRYCIYTGEYGSVPKKAWELCERCYNSLRRGIEKGVQNK